ncbi:hypothetical protein P7C73_g1801, partial [Tremellales sp. Uapishka_1]
MPINITHDLPPRPVRIGGFSGAVSDRREAAAGFVNGTEQIDAIVGDFMSEYNHHPSASTAGRKEDQGRSRCLYCLTRQVVVNAGACDTEGLYHATEAAIAGQGLSGQLTVAWIGGDEVFNQVKAGLSNPSKPNPFTNIYNPEETLESWPHTPIFAQAVAGADIILCGRVADAAPAMGVAAWWHGWYEQPCHHFQNLANALIAGHLIECSTYVTGGDFTGFRGMDWTKAGLLGFPIAEIGTDGEVVITKQENTGGLGPLYYNSDVTADISNVHFTRLPGKDRVLLSGVKGLPPPPTTKIGLTAYGGYRAEFHYVIVGLDVEEKAKFMELQIRNSLGPERISKFSLLTFTVYGNEVHGAKSLAAATADLRIFAQAKNREDLEPHNFLLPLADTTMQGYAANTFHLDMRNAHPAPYLEYFSTLLPLSEIEHVAYLPRQQLSISIPPPIETRTYSRQQVDVPTSDVSVPQLDLGPTTHAPLGYVAHGRSGDKGPNCNMFYFVRNEDEYAWLKAILTTEKLKELLGEEYVGGRIDRFEFDGIWGVHFLLHNHLDRGVSANSTYDTLGKMPAEFIRSQLVDIPDQFLARGRI